MCLIELKNSPKPVVSCALSAKACLNNSEVYTNSPLVKKARENILEFLLLNHPLDCPICDQGGECDLQDQSFFFGLSKKRFYNFKRVVTDKNIGPIVKTVMTRCIHCTRCVRFAKEIAGVEDLGIFGRGISSEIGTYVNKIFNSELSGNIIDLCPVGALTSKQYPFIGRNWELKKAKGLDYSDSFGSNINIFLKNNEIIKILPGTEAYATEISWISDKTRFAFDGMFSMSRILQNYLVSGKNNSFPLTWRKLFTHICYLLYFHDHLNKHFFKKSVLIICFSSVISYEILNLLLIFSQKYPFICLRKIEHQQFNNDLESNFMNKSKDNFFTKLKLSNYSMLLGFNPRYEALPIQLKLRQRYLKGNFKLISLSSNINLTFPVAHMGFNIKVLTSILEGNNFFCQELINSRLPIIFLGTELLKRNDSSNLIFILNMLKTKLKLYHSLWNQIHLVDSTINEAGVNYLKNFDVISEKDFQKIFAVYCVNTNFTNPALKKLIDFKLLNIINTDNKIPKIVIEQNGGFTSSLSKIKNQVLNVFNYINIPNNIFFESSGIYLTTLGFFKKAIKIIVPAGQSKDSWQILRKITSYTNLITYMSNSSYNLNLSYNCASLTNLRNFIGFQYMAVNDLRLYNIASTRVPKTAIRNRMNYRLNRVKIYNTKFRLWLDDFYIGRHDHYSKYSLTMIKCSRVIRQNTTSFLYVD